MSGPIKRSTDAAVRRQDKSDSVDQMMIKDIEFDTAHSLNDEFGYPLWSKPADQGNDGNTSGDTEPVSVDGGDDSEGN